MKPLGLKPFRHKLNFNLHDENHHKVANRWEAEQEPNKTMDKRLARAEIESEINDLN